MATALPELNWLKECPPEVWEIVFEFLHDADTHTLLACRERRPNKKTGKCLYSKFKLGRFEITLFGQKVKGKDNSDSTCWFLVCLVLLVWFKYLSQMA